MRTWVLFIALISCAFNNVCLANSGDSGMVESRERRSNYNTTLPPHDTLHTVHSATHWREEMYNIYVNANTMFKNADSNEDGVVVWPELEAYVFAVAHEAMHNNCTLF